MGSPMRVRCARAMLLLLMACSSSSPRLQRDAEAAPADGHDIIRIPVAHPGDAAGEVGPLCQAIRSLDYDAGPSATPLDWPSAQVLSSWCSLDMDWSRTGLCLAQTSDGYNVAVLAYIIGGEMMFISKQYFLYDPVTGKLVAELFAMPPVSDIDCAFRTPEGPSDPALDSHFCDWGHPLQPVCAPTPDAGSF